MDYSFSNAINYNIHPVYLTFYSVDVMKNTQIGV